MLRSWESIEVISVNVPDSAKRRFKVGEKFIAEVVLDLNEISPEDIGIDVIFGQKEMDEVNKIVFKNEMELVSKDKNSVTYRSEIFMTRSGVFDYAFRMYPKNAMIPHRQDFHLVRWI